MYLILYKYKQVQVLMNTHECSFCSYLWPLHICMRLAHMVGRVIQKDPKQQHNLI